MVLHRCYSDIPRSKAKSTTHVRCVTGAMNLSSSCFSRAADRGSIQSAFGKLHNPRAASDFVATEPCDIFYSSWRFLANAQSGPLIAIGEPETGLHPANASLGTLADSQRSGKANPRFVFTTHSMAYFWTR